MKTYDWTTFPKSILYKEILYEWDSMLSNPKLKEVDYQNFLSSHPSIFLTFFESYFAISKLKLGMDYETDFVIVNEGYSSGTQYELIEIESPHTKLFDKTGKPTAKFNSALQQIRDWKRYLIDNKPFFRKTFPTSTTKIIGESKLKFKIIIGRRNNDQRDLEKRRQISELENVEIISFDRLTEMAKAKKMFSDEPFIYSGEMHSIPYHKRNELANPFYTCTSDSEWRKICYKGHSHFYPNMLDEILEIRRYNKYFDKYKKTLGS